MSPEIVALSAALLFLTGVQLVADQWTPLSPLGGAGSIGSPGGTHPLATDGDTVHLVWMQRGNIQYRLSRDAGVTWGSPITVTSSGTAQYPCSLERSGSTLHLIWPDSRNRSAGLRSPAPSRDGAWEVYYKRSTDAGKTWGPDTRLTPGANLFRLGTAISGSTIHVVWGSTSLVLPTPVGTHTWGELYYIRSTDGGVTWKPTVRLTTPDCSAMRPGIAAVGRASGDYVHVTWFDRRDSKEVWDWDIYYKRSTDGGATWGSDVRMTSTPYHSRHPQIVATPGPTGPGRVCCIWEDGSFVTGTKWEGDSALYAAVSDDNGETWSEARRLTFTNTPNGRATHSKTYASGSRIHLAWTDSPEARPRRRRTPEASEPLGEGSQEGSPEPAGPQAVYYMTSPDGGLTWEAPERLTTASDGSCLGEGVGGTGSYAIVVIKQSDTLSYRRRNLPASGPHAPRQ